MTEASHLDPKTIQLLYDTSEEGATNVALILISKFERNTFDLLDKMQRCIQDGDFDEIKKLAHSFRGSSSMIGAKYAAELAYKVEDSAKSNHLEECCRNFNDLRNETAKLHHTLKTRWPN
jgi:HPt (histidine-containing phosphotransfer) domain-containing protein